MIKNDKQLKISKDWLQKFEGESEVLNSMPDVNPYQKEMQQSAFNDTIQKLKKDIWEYENVKSGNTTTLNIPEMRLCHEALIKARIAKGWSQAELAEKVGLKEQQIQRYEASNYSTASLPRIDEIIYALGINISLRVVGMGKPRLSVPEGHTEESILKIEQKARLERTLL